MPAGSLQVLMACSHPAACRPLDEQHQNPCYISALPAISESQTYAKKVTSLLKDKSLEKSSDHTRRMGAKLRLSQLDNPEIFVEG